MKIIVHVNAGAGQGRRIPMQTGERARFGRSDAADVCFPDDPQMSDVHFELLCRKTDCVLQSLSTSATLVNGQPVSQVSVLNEDVILAGTTGLHVVFPDAVEVPVEPAEQEQSTPKPTAIELCQLVDLEDVSLQVFRPDHSPEDFIQELIQHQQYDDAIRLLAEYLDNDQAIFWAFLVCQELSDGDWSETLREAMERVSEWLREPDEEKRYQNLQFAHDQEFNNLASYLAAAVGHSGGSIAPQGMPAAPAPAGVCGTFVACAVSVAAATTEAVLEIPARQERALAMGKTVLQNGIDLDQLSN
ncbi:FHA domain protein [Stieleria bergensis]|uniref:FHA domain protein n=1 Tax=Stieleria bergensis TaxID=2528025 RepID=A0A517SXK5_9BACT|nr:FHA domain protein [Planctomycetes bacterium SV_7m_r]